MAVTVRMLGLILVILGAVAACSGPAAAMPSVDPADGVTIENNLEQRVAIVYEKPGGETEPVVALDPAASVVVDLFSERDAPCRTGRLVAQRDDGAEVDDLYVVCKGKTWVVEVAP